MSCAYFRKNEHFLKILGKTDIFTKNFRESIRIRRKVCKKRNIRENLAKSHII
jgi:hypothetical protein